MLSGAKKNNLFRKCRNVIMLCAGLQFTVFSPAPLLAGIFNGDSDYLVEITSPSEIAPELSDKLEEIKSTLEQRQTADSSDVSYLRYRFEQDTIYLQKTLKAEGYYDAVIDADYDEKKHTAYFKIEPMEQYKFGSISLNVNGNIGVEESEVKIPTLDIVKAKLGQPAVAYLVYADEAKIYNFLEKHNCLFSIKVGHVAILDDSSRQINIIYNILIGKEATLGDISFKGNNKIATEHLQKLLTIKKGDCFKRKEINAASLALQNTGLLSTVETELTSELGSDGEVPIVFNISERAMRSIKAGANYSTDIGVGVNLGWEHRNFLGYGEKLTTALEIAAPKQAISAQFRKPFFLRDDQRLKLSSSLKREDSDAYQTTGINVSGGIERDIDNKWLVGVGAKYELSRIKDNVSSKDVALLSIPVFASQDKRDDVLDPSYGWTLRVDSTPFFDTINANTVFYKNKIGGTYYQKLPIANKPILALRANTGSIAGINTESVPATERFFAGGGGSIRGYGYQLAGPLDASNNPVGGRSFIETSVELRAKLTNEYGFVLFVDGGNVYDAAIPNFSDKMLFGAGIGVRYYTSFGPLRGDIAIPLDKRTGGVDAPYQLYFSIGQDF